MRVIYIGVAIVLLGYAGLCLLMFMFQRSLLYYPQPSRYSTPRSTVKLEVEGAELVVSVRPLPGARALIYFGGNGEDVSQSLESFSTAFPDYALYLLHYRAYGGSTGKPTEAANSADALALFDRVAAEHSAIAVIGRSLGTGVAVRLASERPVTRLVLVTPYDSIEAIAAAQFPYIPVTLLLRDRYESWRYAPKIRVPTTLLAAENDEIIPRASTVRLLGRFSKGVASMVTIAGVGHNDISARAEYLQTLQTALEPPTPTASPAR